MTQNETIEPEMMASVLLGADEFQKLKQLSTAHGGLPLADEMRIATRNLIEAVVDGEVPVESVIEQGQQPYGNRVQTHLFRVPESFSTDAEFYGMELEWAIRVGIARHVLQCDDPNFAQQLAEGEAAIKAEARDLLNRSDSSS
jgi:hypothetical protein